MIISFVHYTLVPVSPNVNPPTPPSHGMSLQGGVFTISLTSRKFSSNPSLSTRGVYFVKKSRDDKL